MVDDDSRAKKQEMCANSDMIINLPDNVIDQILVRLPILDAVRTSVLSTKWRYKWTTITQLVFCDDLILTTPHDDMNKLIYMIDRVLLFHTGFIHKFELSTTCLMNCSAVDCWIFFLLRKNIKKLVLKLAYWDGEKYSKLPSCLFSAQQISTLELHGCVLKPPPIFTGFSNLKSLYLYYTTFVDKDGFACLISKCPLLERLTLDMIVVGGYSHLNFCSPNLKYLFLSGCFEEICFENTPLLSEVIIHIAYLYVEKLINKVLSSLPSLRKFDAGLGFLKFLTMGKIPKKLPFTCHHLNNLSLRLNFECVNHICVTLCLLNSSPSLRELEIEAYPFYNSGQDTENFWEERTLIHWNMSGLQIVKITEIQGLEMELEFIKLLLANSPMLQMLSIRTCNLDICKGLDYSKELLTFPRASTKAWIKLF